MTKCPPFLRKLWALIATIRAWSGWATSAKIVSTIPKRECASHKLVHVHTKVQKYRAWLQFKTWREEETARQTEQHETEQLKRVGSMAQHVHLPQGENENRWQWWHYEIMESRVPDCRQAPGQHVSRMLSEAWANGNFRKQHDSPTSILYLWGCLASSMIGMTFVLFLATLIRSRPDLCENSTAYTRPS